jgi:hypothetical protein
MCSPASCSALTCVLGVLCGLPHQEADSLVAVLHSMLQLPPSWQPQQRMRQYNGWVASALQDKAVQVRRSPPACAGGSSGHGHWEVLHAAFCWDDQLGWCLVPVCCSRACLGTMQGNLLPLTMGHHTCHNLAYHRRPCAAYSARRPPRGSCASW